MLVFTQASSGLLSQTSNSRRWAAVTVRGCVATRSSKSSAAAASSPARRPCWQCCRAAADQACRYRGEDHFPCLAEPDEGWQQSRVDDRRYADLDFGQAERRGGGHSTKVARQGEFERCPETVPLTAATVTTGECRIARITCAKSPIRACARAGVRPAKASMFIPALKAAWPAPVKRIACTSDARSAMTSRSSLRSCGCKMLSFSGRSKVIQRARPRCCALIYRTCCCSHLRARQLVNLRMPSSWTSRSVGDTRAAAAEGLAGVDDLAAGDTGPGGAPHANRAVITAGSPPANPPGGPAAGRSA